MKMFIVLLAMMGSINVNAQSIKDALFSGKLKNDSNSVVRKGDDLSTKIDTAKKKVVQTEKKEIAGHVEGGDTVNMGPSASVENPSAAGTVSSDPGAAINAGPKDNNKVWKDYIDSIAVGLKAEVLPNKKIKSGTYYVYVEYEIGVDGQVSINNVTPSPDNSFLAEQVKERLTLTAPQLTPMMYNGKPRKSIKKNTFTVTKE